MRKKSAKAKRPAKATRKPTRVAKAKKRVSPVPSGFHTVTPQDLTKKEMAKRAQAASAQGAGA